MGVLLPRDGEHMWAERIIGWNIDIQGNIKSRFDSNPILNAIVYGVMLSDGSVQQYGSNGISENLFSQFDG